MNSTYDDLINKFLIYMSKDEELKDKVIEIKFQNFDDFEAQFVFDICSNLLYLYVKDLKVNVKCSLFTYWKLLSKKRIYKNKRFKKVEKIKLNPHEYLEKFFKRVDEYYPLAIYRYQQLVKNIEKEYYGHIY